MKGRKPVVYAGKTASVAEVVGEVTEVERSPRSLVVHSSSWVKGGNELNLRVEVIDGTSIREGKEAKYFSDIRVGDKVWLRYERNGEMPIAQLIVIKGHEE